MPNTPRRFPPPWSIDKLEACSVVRDDSGQQLTRVSEQIGQPQLDCDR
jgi:hypothetical protein